MAAPLVYKRNAMWVKQEATPYTAETPGTQPLALLDAFEVQFRNNSTISEREGGRGFGNNRGVPGAFGASVTFKTHAFGSASTTWASILLPACNYVASTGGVYSPSSLPPEASGAATKTVTLRVYQDGRYKQLRGAMGTFVIRGVSGQKLEIEWTFTGVMDPPDDVTYPTTSYPTALPIRFADATVTLASFSPVVAEFSIDAGNDVQLREDAADESGWRGAFIANMTPTAELVCEAELTSDYDADAIFRAATTAALAMSIGGSGNQLDIDAPAAQVLPVNDSNRGGKLYEPLSLVLCRTAGSDGDDMLTLTLG